MASLYELMQLNKAAHHYKTSYIPYGYQLLHTSNQIGFSIDGYYGVAAINYAAKEIIICNAGTKIDKDSVFNTALDFVSDVQIFNKRMPEQFKHAFNFAKFCLKGVGEDYKIFLTGFSLGAVLADLVAYKLINSEFDIKSITFENPGAAEIISRKSNANLENIKDHFEVYNAAVPNLVNILGHKNQVGDTSLVCLDRKKFTDDMGKIGNILLAGHAFDNFSEAAFDDNHNILLCGENLVVEQIFDVLGALFK